MTHNRIIQIVLEELYRAEIEHPVWPRDVVHGAAIVVEEAGELVRAALDRHYGRAADDSQLIKEAIQTTAMGLRFLFNLYNKGRKL